MTQNVANKPQNAPNESHDWDETARATYRRLSEKADADQPAAWMPTEPGDELMGVLVDVNVAAPTKYGPAAVCTLETPEGPRSLWLLHAVLRRSFERAKPAIGETVLVRYLGTVTPEGEGRAYENYQLVLDRETQPFTWDEVAKRYGDDKHIEADPDPAPTVCEACGFEEPNHAAGCPNDIPF